METNFIIWLCVIFLLCILYGYGRLQLHFNTKLKELEGKLSAKFEKLSNRIFLDTQDKLATKIEQGFDVSSKDIVFEVYVEDNRSILKSVSLRELVNSKQPKYQEVFIKVSNAIANYERNNTANKKKIDSLERKILSLTADITKSKDNGAKLFKEVYDRIAQLEENGIVVLQEEDDVISDNGEFSSSFLENDLSPKESAEMEDLKQKYLPEPKQDSGIKDRYNTIT